MNRSNHGLRVRRINRRTKKEKKKKRGDNLQKQILEETYKTQTFWFNFSIQYGAFPRMPLFTKASGNKS